MKFGLPGLIAFSLFAFTSSLSASSLIVPASCATADCPGSQAVASVGIAISIQQIFDASLFTGVTGPVSITGVALRPAPGTDTATLGDVQMTILGGNTLQDANAGCTALPAATGCTYTTMLSTVGDTTLFSGTSDFSTTDTGTPRPFDFAISFTAPLTYNPTSGQNLLLTLQLPRDAVSGTNGSLDFEAIGSGNRQSGTGAVESILGPVSGLVVQFSYTAVPTAPEPGTLGLLGVGLAGFGLLFRHRNRKRS
jgi:hypothetical protein